MSKRLTPVVKISKIISPGIFAPEALEGASSLPFASKLPKLRSDEEGAEQLGQLPFFTTGFEGETFPTHQTKPDKPTRPSWHWEWCL